MLQVVMLVRVTTSIFQTCLHLQHTKSLHKNSILINHTLVCSHLLFLIKPFLIFSLFHNPQQPALLKKKNSLFILFFFFFSFRGNGRPNCKFWTFLRFWFVGMKKKNGIWEKNGCVGFCLRIFFVVNMKGCCYLALNVFSLHLTIVIECRNDFDIRHSIHSCSSFSSNLAPFQSESELQVHPMNLNFFKFFQIWKIIIIVLFVVLDFNSETRNEFWSCFSVAS